MSFSVFSSAGLNSELRFQGSTIHDKFEGDIKLADNTLKEVKILLSNLLI